jgi:hypothetical protein
MLSALAECLGYGLSASWFVDRLRQPGPSRRSQRGFREVPPPKRRIIAGPKPVIELLVPEQLGKVGADSLRSWDLTELVSLVPSWCLRSQEPEIRQAARFFCDKKRIFATLYSSWSGGCRENPYDGLLLNGSLSFPTSNSHLYSIVSSFDALARKMVRITIRS